MTDTTQQPRDLKRVNSAILQFLLDGQKGRTQVAEDVSRMTGIRLSASSVLIVERLGLQSMRVNDLGVSVGISSGAITRQVQDLEAKGLVERTADLTDKRAALVKLSELGLEVIRLSEGIREFSIRHAVRGWTDEEVAQVTALLERLADSLRDRDSIQDMMRKIQRARVVSVDDWMRLIGA